MKQFLIILLLLLIIFTGSAQSLQFKTYSVNDGLVSRNVRRIFQDSKGFLWIATWEGLSKYDGARFLNFTPANNFPADIVNDIYEDSAGHLIAALNNGSVIMIKADTVVHSSFFTKTVINQFVPIGKKIYAATDRNGIYGISGNELVQIKRNQVDRSYNFLSRLNDSLLIGGGGFNFFEIISTTGRSLFSFETSSFVNCGLPDGEKKLWIGTGRGLMLFEFSSQYPANTRLLKLPSSLDIEFVRNNIIWDLLKDHQGNIWMATDKGLLCYATDESVTIYTSKDGLPSATANCLYQDREKNIWIGTTQGFAKLVTKNNYRQWTHQHGLFNVALKSIGLQSPAELIITSSDGAQFYNTIGNQFSRLKKTPSGQTIYLSANKIDPLLYTDGLWTGEWDKKKRILKSRFLPSGFCRDKDHRGWIYSCRSSKIYITIKDSTYEDGSLPPHRYEKLLADSKGYLWLGSWETGLYRLRYNIDNGKLKKEFLDLNNQLPAKEIRSLFEDRQGNIWAGTRHDGLYVLISNGDDSYNVQHFGNKEGLSSSWVLSTAEDDNGNIWAGTYQGLDKLIRTSTGFRVFNFSSLNNVTAQISDIAVGGNNIWCASSEGLLRFTDESADTLSAPPLWITSFSISGYEQHADAIKTDTVFHLKPKQNTVAFSFSAGSLFNEKRILYSYRLVGGRDTSWSSPANEHNINYASLRPGRYRFEVLCFGLNGKPGEIKTISFIIHRPFTETAWFYVLCAVALACITFGLYRYRIRQIMQLQKVRSQIAADLHDEIGGSLTNIGLLSAIVEKNIDEKKETKPFLFRIREDINSSAQALDDIIWSVNAANDSAAEMLARMRHYAAEVFENAGLKYKLVFPENERDMYMKMEQRRDIYLVFKEATNNIVKHANATSATVEVQINDTSIRLTIYDNGKGFTKTNDHHRNGLLNMEKRASKWNGTIYINSGSGQGTTVIAEIPLR